MSFTVPQSFVTKWSAEVFHDYQLAGSQLRPYTRTQFFDSQDEMVFHKMGTGEATQKARHANMVPMNVGHSTVNLTVETWYAAEYIDDIDKFMTNINLQSEYKQVIVNALGRKEDDITITELARAVAAAGAGNTITLAAAANPKLNDILQWLLIADEANIARSNLVIGISPRMHAELSTIETFQSADYGPQRLMSHTTTFQWLGVQWFVYNGLPIDAGNVRTAFMYDRSNVIKGILKDIQMKIERVPEKDAWLCHGKLSVGDLAIRDEGVFSLEHDEDALFGA